MKLSLEQYKEILSVALDHQLAYLRGTTVFDDYDPAVEQDKILRADVDRYVQEGKVAGLKKMLNHLIKSFFELRDEYNFRDYLFEKSGYKIKPIPQEYISVSERKRLHVGVSGKAESAITCVQILLPTISGIIYCIRGSYPMLKATWTDDHLIEVEIPEETEELERVHQVRYHGEVINILYKEPKP